VTIPPIATGKEAMSKDISACPRAIAVIGSQDSLSATSIAGFSTASDAMGRPPDSAFIEIGHSKLRMTATPMQV
jgi:hypothetical protein